MNLNDEQMAVICNGRVIGPFNDEEFTNEDFSLLERFSENTYGLKLYGHLIKNQALEDENGNHLNCQNFYQIIV